MITIKDIARIAGVSQSTVSKALNDQPDVGQETKKRILNIAREHHFTPHVFGKALKKKSSEIIGVLFCRDLHSISGNPFYSRVLEGIETELAINNYSLVLKIISQSTKDELPKMIRERQVDGLILVGTFIKSYLDRILKQNLRLVLVDPKEPKNKLNQILIDNEYGAFQATTYLIQHGHERIGFISGDLSRLSFRQRYNGYVKALQHAGIQVNPGFIRTGGLENGYEHVRQLLDSQTITAIFAANDINAVYGYKAINERNLRIPEDVSVIGFDDIDLAGISSPPLTTVRVEKEELGSIAVRTLLKVIRDGFETPCTVIIKTQLIERKSVKSIDPNTNKNQNNSTNPRDEMFSSTTSYSNPSFMEKGGGKSKRKTIRF
jgi:LacI family transcriptional regulator